METNSLFPMMNNIKGEEQEDQPLPFKITKRPTKVFEDVHVFYYPWYANVKTDGKWSHWNHNILPHWDAQIRNSVCFSLFLSLFNI